MTEFQHLVKTLEQFRSTAWINQYFDLLKRILTEMQLDNDDPRLAMSNPRNNTLPVNLGQRYILKPLPKEYIRCIVPAAFAEQAVQGTLIGWFSAKTTRDAKWIQLHWPTGTPLPEILYRACLEASMDILAKSKKSGFRKYHLSLLYDFTMEMAVRNEVLKELRILVD